MTEVIMNKAWYLNTKNLAINLPNLETGILPPEKYALFSGSSGGTPRDCYNKETIRCFKTNAYCRLWQIHHLAFVMGRSIVSIFPEFEDVEDDAPLWYYHKRVIYP